jgi:squalene-hopene/tetraprenyl-beta-curcumene cyclase
MAMDVMSVDRSLHHVRSALLAARSPAGHWVGRLSSSALSTSTAVIALSVVDREARARARPGASVDTHSGMIRTGLDWLVKTQNADGGFGDTDRSASNISTTALAWAAFGAAGETAGAAHRDAAGRAEAWLAARAGGRTPDRIAAAIVRRYGDDRTFSVPILTACALAGRLGEGRGAWRHVRPLPFELAAFPPSWFPALGLPVVSYALPALIAVGQARYHHRPPLNPLRRILRAATRGRTLRRLEAIQPAGGGFLEAVPLTSFVVMSLAGGGAADHPVVASGLDFIVRSVRHDGSWPIDTNLATWLTTLAVNALAGGPDFAMCLSEEERPAVVRWLLDQQNRTVHPYTQAAPGGWAWTDLPGGVPDADDTAGALLALRALAAPEDDPGGLPEDETVRAAAIAGVTWLLDLQNDDGGIPTFCRGWGKLPFDRSGADLTAHALRAVAAWKDALPEALRARAEAFAAKAAAFLAGARRPNGAWMPLWFGNERSAGEENPVHGTSRVLLALAETAAVWPAILAGALAQAAGGATWLLRAQHGDGGWGGAPGVPASVEETALAVEGLAALAGAATSIPGLDAAAVRAGVEKGAAWLARRANRGWVPEPAPLGFYFANLWYYEKLYPPIFVAAALGRARRVLA